MNTFPDRLTKVIDWKKLSCYKISRDTKITEATLSNYCKGKGKRGPNASIVHQLAAYLEVDPLWLLDGKGKEPEFLSHTLLDPEGDFFIKKQMEFTAELNGIISFCKKELENRDEQLAVKDKQLAEKDEQIKDLLIIVAKLSSRVPEGD